MTDITGTYGINPHYDKDIQAKKECTGECCGQEQDKACETPSQVDLDKQPAAVSGRALVKKADKTGEYKFDPKQVENDVQEYKLLRDIIGDTLAAYRQAGFDKETARQKTFDFVYGICEQAILEEEGQK